jgi:hypothetical protein
MQKKKKKKEERNETFLDTTTFERESGALLVPSCQDTLRPASPK